MIIDGRNYTVNVLILFMEHEDDVTVATVETLMEDVQEGVIVSILLNGGSRADLRKMLSASSHIRYYESLTNLGVAGGRNFLLDTVEAVSSDIIMFMDNDVIPTTDYVRSLATFLLDHPDAGIVGATLLNIKPFFEKHPGCFHVKRGFFGNTISTVTNKALKGLLMQSFEATKLYHLGTDIDWYQAYFTSREQYENICEYLGIIRRRRFWAQLKFNKAKSFSFLNSRVKELNVSNIWGGAQAFRRSLIDDVGKLNDLFSPFGYEDVDFCIRAVKRGYRNFIDTNTFLLHGTDARQTSRQDFNFQANVSNEFRCLTLLYRLHFPDRFEELIRRRIFYEYMMRYVNGEKNADEILYCCLKGRRNGLKQIEKISSL
jgi:GT2 family glycosyltransferase